MVAYGAQTAPFILGLTGPIACGKTTVGTMLLEFGALAHIDADEVVHELMEAGTETTRRVEHAFGKEIIGTSGAVDRVALGARVFGHPESLRLLESIVHPAVRPAVREQIAGFAGQDGVVILDAVKLLQGDLAELCEGIWVVQCDRREELRRLMTDRGMTQQAAEERIAAQPAFDDARVSAQIDNSGALEATRAEVERLWRDIAAGNKGGPPKPRV